MADGGVVECPLSNNPLEVGGETDSLGSVEAPRLWRTAALERTGAGLLLLATDGLSNAFEDDDQWYAFARSLGERIRDFGPISVASSLPGWLDHYLRMPAATISPRHPGSQTAVSRGSRPGSIPSGRGRPPPPDAGTCVPADLPEASRGSFFRSPGPCRWRSARSSRGDRSDPLSSKAARRARGGLPRRGTTEFAP